MSQPLEPGAVKPGWTTSEFWQTLLVHAVAAIIALGTVFHTNFHLNGLQSVVPSVAVFASAITQAVYSHSRATVKSSAQAAAVRAHATTADQGQPVRSGPTPIIVEVTGLQPAPSPAAGRHEGGDAAG